MEDRSEQQNGFRFTPRLVVGFFIAFLGGLLLLDNLGYLEAEDYFRFWPLVLILVGAAKVLQRQGVGFGVVLLILGTLLLLDNLGQSEFDGDLLIPAVILLVGLNLLWKELTWRARRRREGGTDPRDEVSSLAMMGGIRHIITSEAFRGGSATAIMGGVELDLRQAELAGGRAVIDTFSWWGGVDVFVPEHWAIVFKGVPIMGAFEDNTRQTYVEGAPQLVISGLAIMGGVEVRNAPKKEE